MARKTASDRYWAEKKRVYEEECRAIGVEPYRIPKSMIHVWGLGEGDIWHYIWKEAHPVWSYFDWKGPRCDYEGYVIANVAFYDADLGEPPFNVCETCRVLKVMHELAE